LRKKTTVLDFWKSIPKNYTPNKWQESYDQRLLRVQPSSVAYTNNISTSQENSISNFDEDENISIVKDSHRKLMAETLLCKAKKMLETVRNTSSLSNKYAVPLNPIKPEDPITIHTSFATIELAIPSLN